MHSYFSTVTRCTSQINTYTVNDLLFITKPKYFKDIIGKVILFYQKKNIYFFRINCKSKKNKFFLFTLNEICLLFCVTVSLCSSWLNEIDAALKKVALVVIFQSHVSIGWFLRCKIENSTTMIQFLETLSLFKKFGERNIWFISIRRRFFSSDLNNLVQKAVHFALIMIYTENTMNHVVVGSTWSWHFGRTRVLLLYSMCNTGSWVWFPRVYEIEEKQQILR